MSATSFSLVLLTALITMAANLLLRLGIDRAGGFNPASVIDTFFEFLRLLLNPLFFLGFVSYFLASLVWFRVVGSTSLSIAYPVLVSLTFVLVTGACLVLFGDPLSTRKILGLALIIAGVALVSSSGVA